MTLEETASKLFVKKKKKTLTSKLSSMLMATFICHFTHLQYPQHEEANKYNKHKPHSHTQPPLHHCDSAHTNTVFYSILEEPTIATSATTQHLVLTRKPFAESLKSSSEMSLVHPQVREFFENWHRPAFSK